MIKAGRLPEPHYLPYDQVKELVQITTASGINNKPEWLYPDFYLPSVNIENLIPDDCNDINTEDKENLASVIGAPIGQIDQYLDERRKKKCDKTANTVVGDS